MVFCARDDDFGDDLHYVPVLAQEFIIAMNADSPLADKEFIVPEDLEDVELITYREQIPLGKAVKATLDTWNLPNVRYAFDDESILAGFAANGVEVALMLDTFFLNHVQGIVVKPLYNNATRRSVSITRSIWRSTRRNTIRSAWMISSSSWESSELDRSDPDMLFFD